MCVSHCRQPVAHGMSITTDGSPPVARSARSTVNPSLSGVSTGRASAKPKRSSTRAAYGAWLTRTLPSPVVMMKLR